MTEKAADPPNDLTNRPTPDLETSGGQRSNSDEKELRDFKYTVTLLLASAIAKDELEQEAYIPLHTIAVRFLGRVARACRTKLRPGLD